MTPKPRKRVEDATLDQIIQVAKTIGYLTFHVYDSRRSSAGFPDLWICGFGILIVLELKTGRNTTTPEQDAWLAELRTAGVDARIYHTDQWKDRCIVDELISAARRWKTTRRDRTRPDISLGAIQIRLSRYSEAPNDVKASALAADVPVLLKHIEWLNGELQATKRIAAGASI